MSDGLIGAIIGALLSSVVTYIVAKKADYVNATTQSRIEWIKTLRELSADFIDECYRGNHNNADSVLTKIRMHMNPISEIDKEIIDIAKKALGSHDTDDFEMSMKAYLKTEWERVKFESEGKMYSQYMFFMKYKSVSEELKMCNKSKEGKTGTASDKTGRTCEDKAVSILMGCKVCAAVLGIILMAAVIFIAVRILLLDSITIIINK